MQFTIFITLFATFAATSVCASPLEQRQTPVGIGYIRFYADTACTKPFVEDTIFNKGDRCLSNKYMGPYGSFKVQDNGFRRTARLFSSPVCNGFGQGPYVDAAPGETGCFAAKVTSCSFL